MKKKIVILLIICFVTLSGCNKTLECSKKTEKNGIKSSINIKSNFRGKKVKSVNIDYEIDIDEKYNILTDLIKESYLKKFEKYKSDGVNVSVDYKDTKIIYKLDFEVPKMKKLKSDSIYLIDATSDYKNIKKSLEKEGYTCK